MSEIERGELRWSGAESYERFMGRWSRLLAVSFVDFAEVSPGDEVLDVGCGTGSVIEAMLERGATVKAVEPSASFGDFARERFLGKPVDIVEASAEDMPFPGASFDRCVSMLVLNFVPNLPLAVGEMHRVTRAGGAVAAAVWDYGEGMEMLWQFWEAAESMDPDLKNRSERHTPLSREELVRLWQEAGSTSVRSQALTITTRFESFDDYWLPFLLGVGPAGKHAAGLSREAQEELREHLLHRVFGDRPDRPIDLQARAWAVCGAA